MTDDLVITKRYRLTLSVWIEQGGDFIELPAQRRTAQYIVSRTFDPPKDLEKVLIKDLCEKIMGRAEQ